MASNPTKFADLSVVEQWQFNSWIANIQTIANRSKRAGLTTNPCQFIVFDSPLTAGGHRASITGTHFRITQDLLAVSWQFAVFRILLAKLIFIFIRPAVHDLLKVFELYKQLIESNNHNILVRMAE